MYRNWQPFLIITVFMALFLTLYFNLGSEKNIQSPLIGKKHPNFSVNSWRDNSKKLNNNIFNNKFSIINVWASWCTTCYAEHKVLMKISQQKKVQIVGINYKDDKKNANKFLHKLGNPYEKILFDPKGDIGLELGVYAVPETFLVNQKGVIIYRHIGELKYDVWLDKFLPFIDKI